MPDFIPTSRGIFNFLLVPLEPNNQPSCLPQTWSPESCSPVLLSLWISILLYFYSIHWWLALFLFVVFNVQLCIFKLSYFHLLFYSFNLLFILEVFLIVYMSLSHIWSRGDTLKHKLTASSWPEVITVKFIKTYF